MAEAGARSPPKLARQVVRSELAARPELVAQVAEEAVNAVLLSRAPHPVQRAPR